MILRGLHGTKLYIRTHNSKTLLEFVCVCNFENIIGICLHVYAVIKQKLMLPFVMYI